MRRLAAVLVLTLATGALAQGGYTPEEYSANAYAALARQLCDDEGADSDALRSLDPAGYVLQLEERTLPACKAVLRLDPPPAATHVRSPCESVVPESEEACEWRPAPVPTGVDRIEQKLDYLRHVTEAAGGTFSEVPTDRGENLAPWTAADADALLFRVLAPPDMRAILVFATYSEPATGETGVLVTTHPF